MLHMHVWDHDHIEHTARSFVDGDAFKREVLRRLYRVSKYPTTQQINGVIDHG